MTSAKPFSCFLVAVQPRIKRMAKSGFVDQELLAMALIGYKAQNAKLDTAIADIQAQLASLHRRLDLSLRFVGSAR